jgi:hypothetical protein
MIAKNGKKFGDSSAEVVTASFLHYVGKKVSRLFRSDGTENAPYKEIVAKLDGFYAKAVNADFEKYTFSLARQAKNEPFDAFVNQLRVLSTNCGFNDPTAEIRTRIIHGCFSEQLRVKALAKGLDAAALIATGRAMERAKSQAHLITEMETVNSIKEYKKPTSNRSVYTNKNDRNVSGSAVKCKYCGRDHVPGKPNCPAAGKKCNKCKQSNHFANVCISTQKQVVYAISESNDRGKHSGYDSDNSDYVFSINSGKKGLPTVEISIDSNSAIMMYIDIFVVFCNF